MDCDTNMTRVALFLRYDFKFIIGQIFRENGIFFDEEVFFQNTSIDFEQLVQEAFCYGANIAPPNDLDSDLNLMLRGDANRQNLYACASF